MARSDKNVDLLRSERDRFVAFSFASADILVELSENGNILFLDGAVSGFLGKKADELIGHPFISLIHPEDYQRATDLLEQRLKEDRVEQVCIHLTSKFGDAIPFAMSGYKLSALKNHYYLTLTFLKERMRPEDLQKRDDQTGLFRKEVFAEAASQKIKEAKQHGKNVSITLVDLPELKEFLDTLPQDAAHELLHDINQYIRQSSLGGDAAGIAGEGAYGLLLDPKVNADQVMEKLFQITRAADPKGVGIRARAETIATDNAPALTDQDCANALLYTINLFAATEGADFSIHTLSAGYQKMLDETVNKITEFKNTVDGNKFQLAFQPIVDLKSGITHHYEALVRFNDGDSSFQNPFSFIEFGEQAGIIGDFDLSMCQRAVEVLMDAQFDGHNPKVAVNLSGKSLSSNLYMDALREITKRNKKVEKQLIFEVTESAKITDFEGANDFLQEMRGNGFLCCLDDFGVGESSFSYLRNLQVDFVKIDGSYVRESMSTKRGQHLLKAMAGMCKDLGITTIGEFVEDEKVANILWESGVKFGQGYYFGKPTLDTSELKNCALPHPTYHGPATTRAKSFSTKPKWTS